MMLSENFSLEEMIRSDAAIRLGIRNVPDDTQTDNLRRLCVEILEPLRAGIGKPIRITSGLRVPVLNTIIGGVSNSDHCLGRAADIQVEGMSAKSVCEAIKSLDLPYRQVIHEFGAWCHVSIGGRAEPPKRECLTAIKVAGKTVYEKGIV
jgi:zinc D-Ala-D-Ala carboxypeptidase